MAKHPKDNDTIDWVDSVEKENPLKDDINKIKENNQDLLNESKKDFFNSIEILKFDSEEEFVAEQIYDKVYVGIQFKENSNKIEKIMIVEFNDEAFFKENINLLKSEYQAFKFYPHSEKKENYDFLEMIKDGISQKIKKSTKGLSKKELAELESGSMSDILDEDPELKSLEDKGVVPKKRRKPKNT